MGRNRKVPQIAFKPDWAKHANAARSSATIRCWTCCRSASWSSGHRIQENLADKARKLGIPVWKFGKVARSATLHPHAIYALNSLAQLNGCFLRL